jgi:hypothetical protein
VLTVENYLYVAGRWIVLLGASANVLNVKNYVIPAGTPPVTRWVRARVWNFTRGYGHGWR